MGPTERERGQPDLRRIGLHPDFWYPMARSRDLKINQPLSVAFAGDPIVLVRTESGAVFALEDRCAHRQMPLSLGVVQGERLKCCYHGWCYDRTGRCVSIPGFGPVEERPRGVRAYPAREAYGLVFVFPGDESKAGSVAFPEIPSFDHETHKTLTYAREVRCHYTFMHENLMDMSHQFLHRKLMGSIQATVLDRRSGTDWVEVDYRFERKAGKPMFGANFLTGKRPKGEDHPGYDIMTIRTHYPYQWLQVRRPNSDEPVMRLWAVYVPTDREQRRCRSYGLLMVRRPRKQAWILDVAAPVMRRFTESIFTEDRMAVEAEQRAYDQQGGDWNHEISPVMLDLRACLRRNGVPSGPQS